MGEELTRCEKKLAAVLKHLEDTYSEGREIDFIRETVGAVAEELGRTDLEPLSEDEAREIFESLDGAYRS